MTSRPGDYAKLLRLQIVTLDNEQAPAQRRGINSPAESRKSPIERTPTKDFQSASADFERLSPGIRFSGDRTGLVLQALRSQFMILEPRRGRYPKYLPYAFTAEGVAMLSSVLRSTHAAQVSGQRTRLQLLRGREG